MYPRYSLVTSFFANASALAPGQVSCQVNKGGALCDLVMEERAGHGPFVQSDDKGASK
jgi:hypothetical protein